MEAGLCATQGFGALLMTAALAPHLLAGLHPRPAPPRDGDPTARVGDYLVAANAVCNVNAFDINCGELEHGPRHYVTQLAVWRASDGAQKERLIAAGLTDVQKHKFLTLSASKINAAPTAEAFHTTFGFARAEPPPRDAPPQPLADSPGADAQPAPVAFIFVITHRAVRAGEELLTYYGPGYDGDGVVAARIPPRVAAEVLLGGYVAFHKLRRAFPFPPAL